VSFLLSVSSAEAADPAVPPRVTAFLQTYCIDCHGATKPKGDFRVDALKVSANAADAENWQLVLDNLHLGEMPPKDEKQPKSAEVEGHQLDSNELSRAAACAQGDRRRGRAATAESRGVSKHHRRPLSTCMAISRPVFQTTAGARLRQQRRGVDALGRADAGIHEGGGVCPGPRHRAGQATRDGEQDIDASRRQSQSHRTRPQEPR
jgi:hypothetical protein